MDRLHLDVLGAHTRVNDPRDRTEVVVVQLPLHVVEVLPRGVRPGGAKQHKSFPEDERVKVPEIGFYIK